MSYNSGSKNTYGTINIELQNTSDLQEDVSYDYIAQKQNGGPFKGYATVRNDGTKLVLVDNSFTLPDNPPPYSDRSEIQIQNSDTGQLVLNTYITDIVNHGEKEVFSYGSKSQETINKYTATQFDPTRVANVADTQTDTQTLDYTDDGRPIEIRPGVFQHQNDNLLYYKDGSTIPIPPLTDTYQRGGEHTQKQQCHGCQFFNEVAGYCSKYRVDARHQYWCSSWGDPKRTDTVEDFLTGDSKTTYSDPKYRDLKVRKEDEEKWKKYKNKFTEDTGSIDTQPTGSRDSETDDIDPPNMVEGFEVDITLYDPLATDGTVQLPVWWYPTPSLTHYEFGIQVHIIGLNPSGDWQINETITYSDNHDSFDIQINQIKGELAVPYRIVSTFEGNSVIKIDRDSDGFIGGDAQFEIIVNFNKIYNDSSTNYLDILVNQTATFETPIISIEPEFIDDEEVEYFPTGSDGAAIIPDEKTIKRMIREKVYEGMYSAVITSDLGPHNIMSFQQTIRDGAMTVGRNADDILIYTKKDGNVLGQTDDEIEDIVTQIYADGEDIWANSTNMSYIQNQIENFDITYFTDESEYAHKIYKVQYGDGDPKVYAKAQEVTNMWNWINVPNIPNIDWIEDFGKTIDKTKAYETLDTTIYELLPYQRTRQTEVDELFSQLNSSDMLGNVPGFDGDGNITEEQLAEDSGSRISENESSSAPITRLDTQTNLANTNKTIQGLRNTLNTYLKDVDNVVEEVEDDRPEYQNRAEGFLKLRKPNQAIIIRNPDGGELDFQKDDSYLTDGFTITMWVRFVGRTGLGTLFSFGNPYKADVENRYGFRLETFTVSQKDRYPDYPNNVGTSQWITPNSVDNWSWQWPVGHVNENGDMIETPFYYSDYERFVRLVVWDHTDTTPYNTVSNLNGSPALANDDGSFGKLYDSHFGTLRKGRQRLWDPGWYEPNEGVQGHVGSGIGDLADGNIRKTSLPVYFPIDEYGDQGQGGAMAEFAFNYTRIPTDNLDEWFFICATYDPTVDEKSDWQNYSSDGSYRCKVEVISRRDLLTARGFKVEEIQAPMDQDQADTTDYYDYAGDGPPVASFNYTMQAIDDTDFFE